MQSWNYLKYNHWIYFQVLHNVQKWCYWAKVCNCLGFVDILKDLIKSESNYLSAKNKWCLWFIASYSHIWFVKVIWMLWYFKDLTLKYLWISKTQPPKHCTPTSNPRTPTSKTLHNNFKWPNSNLKNSAPQPQITQLQWVNVWTCANENEHMKTCEHAREWVSSYPNLSMNMCVNEREHV